MKTKHETFVYEGLGFPVKLIDCPMKKMLDEWVLDINLVALQRFVFQGLIHKSYPLTGREIRFMRKFLGLSIMEAGKKLGVSHATVVKWENEQTRIGPSQESYLRLLFCELFKDSELLRLYKKIRPETLAKAKREKHVPFEVRVKELDVASF
jgi:DNA-binding transcriptional regulator YiaG